MCAKTFNEMIGQYEEYLGEGLYSQRKWNKNSDPETFNLEEFCELLQAMELEVKPEGWPYFGGDCIQATTPKVKSLVIATLPVHRADKAGQFLEFLELDTLVHVTKGTVTNTWKLSHDMGNRYLMHVESYDSNLCD